MGDIEVAQRTKDGMFNATAFVKSWNAYAIENELTCKELKDYLELKGTKEFIIALEKEPEFLNGDNSPYLTSRGKYNGGTWMHPLMFLDLAMWVNPQFKVKVLKFVQDQLIAFRNEAGDAYKQLSGAVAKLSNKDTMQDNIRTVAKAVNCVTYGYHEAELRNKIGDEAKMKQLMELERHIAQLVSEGFITKFNDEADAEHSLIAYLREQWKKRWAENPIDKLIS